MIASSRDSMTTGPGHTQQKEGDLITVPLVVKGDVMGSVEALVEILTGRQPHGFRLKVVQSGVGPISDGDLDMAVSTKGGCGLYWWGVVLRSSFCPVH